MSIQFPSSPVLDQTYTLGIKTWKWNGYAWDLQSSGGGGGGGYTDITPAFDQANTAFDKANSATILAQSAYDYANTVYILTSSDAISPFLLMGA